MRTGLLLGLGLMLACPPVATAQIAVPGAIAKPAMPPPAAGSKPTGSTARAAAAKGMLISIAAPTPGYRAPVALPNARPTALPSPSQLPAAPRSPSLSAPLSAQPIAIPLAPAPPQVPRLWGSAEYLMWWTSAAPVPTPMVTAATNLADFTSGQLNSPNTATLLGGQSYNTAMRSGGRFTLGTWLDPEGRYGLSGTYLFLAPSTTFHTVSSDGTVPIGLPFYDVFAGAQGFAPLAVPGLRTGGAFLALTNRLQGGEINGSAQLWRGNGAIVSALGGFRYLNLDENLGFGFGATDNTAGALPGSHFVGFDRFNANNNFFGGQLGLRGVLQRGNWFVSVTGKCAFGDVSQNASVSGGFVTYAPTAPFPPITFAAPAGFYALPTNIGQHSHSAFGVLPEGTINVGYNLGPNVRIFTGYNFLYLSAVERPGTAIQNTINSSVSPGFVGPGAPLIGPAVPSYSFTRSDFWAQGFNFGVQMRY